MELVQDTNSDLICLPHRKWHSRISWVCGPNVVGRALGPMNLVEHLLPDEGE